MHGEDQERGAVGGKGMSARELSTMHGGLQVTRAGGDVRAGTMQGRKRIGGLCRDRPCVGRDHTGWPAWLKLGLSRPV